MGDLTGKCDLKTMKTPDTCAEPDDMDAVSACKQWQEKSKGFFESVADTTKSFTPAGLIGAFTGNSDSKNETINNIRNQLNQTQMSEQLNACKNKVKQDAANVLEVSGISPECMKILTSAGGISADDILELSTVSNIKQTNTQEAVAKCEMDVLMQSLSKLDLSVDNLVAQDSVSKASGLMSNSASENKNCNDISNETNACQWLSQQTCCNNEIASSALNTISLKGGCGQRADNLIQENVQKALAECRMGTEAKQEAEGSLDAKAEIEQQGKSEAEGLTPMAIFGIVMGILAIALCIYLVKTFLL